jgi:hypothetical protein
LASSLVAASCCGTEDCRKQIDLLRESIREVRPYLPQPAGIAADVLSLGLAIFATKKASSARRRATRNRDKAAPPE